MKMLKNYCSQFLKITFVFLIINSSFQKLAAQETELLLKDYDIESVKDATPIVVNALKVCKEKNIKKFLKYVDFDCLQRQCEQKNVKALSTILYSRSAMMNLSIVLRSTSLPKSAHLRVTLRAAQRTLSACALASF